MKVLIGYDGSDCAKASIEDLVLAGLPADVEALILSVADMLVRVPYEDYQPAKDSQHWPTAKLVRTARALAADAMHAAQETAIEGVAMVTTLFPGWDVSSEAVADSPYWALVKTAEEWRADLVVVGAQGRFALGHLFLGSVSQNVLGHAICSVRVGRTRERESAAPPRIILAVDGSPDADMAVECVAQRAWPDETHVRVVTAIDLQLALAIAYDSKFLLDCPDEPDAATAARCHADAVVRRLSDAGLVTTPLVERGDPKKLLIDEARRWNADAIFVGAKGHNRLERFLLGSVSSAVAARAPCTVEVVRALGTAPGNSRPSDAEVVGPRQGR
jgi:nucleotide-binding universal stress UspA family protein